MAHADTRDLNYTEYSNSFSLTNHNCPFMYYSHLRLLRRQQPATLHCNAIASQLSICTTVCRFIARIN